MSGSDGRLRRATASALAVVPIVAIAVVGIALRPRLGTTVASHWSVSLVRPDGFTSTWGSFWVFTALTAVFSALGVVLIALTSCTGCSRSWAGVATLIAGSTATAWIMGAWATADAGQTGTPVLGWRLALILAALASGVAVYLLVPPSAPRLTEDAERPTIPLREGDRISWTGVTGSRVLDAVTVLMVVLFVAALVFALVSGQFAVWVSAILFAVVSVGCIGLARVRLIVDRRGIRLVSVLLRVPVIRVSLDSITSVTADTIEPAQWGGWGIRISGAGLAYVARRGPGIIIERRSGNAVAITIDHADQPAAVANALLAQRKGSQATRIG